MKLSVKSSLKAQFARATSHSRKRFPRSSQKIGVTQIILHHSRLPPHVLLDLLARYLSGGDTLTAAAVEPHALFLRASQFRLQLSNHHHCSDGDTRSRPRD